MGRGGRREDGGGKLKLPSKADEKRDRTSPRWSPPHPSSSFFALFMGLLSPSRPKALIAASLARPISLAPDRPDRPQLNSRPFNALNDLARVRPFVDGDGDGDGGLLPLLFALSLSAASASFPLALVRLIDAIVGNGFSAPDAPRRAGRPGRPGRRRRHRRTD